MGALHNGTISECSHSLEHRINLPETNGRGNSRNRTSTYGGLLLLLDGLHVDGGVNLGGLVLLVEIPELLHDATVGGHLEVAVPLKLGGLLGERGHLQGQVIVLLNRE